VRPRAPPRCRSLAPRAASLGRHATADGPHVRVDPGPDATKHTPDTTPLDRPPPRRAARGRSSLKGVGSVLVSLRYAKRCSRAFERNGMWHGGPRPEQPLRSGGGGGVNPPGAIHGDRGHPRLVLNLHPA
jgi:hypothetical protein